MKHILLIAIVWLGMVEPLEAQREVRRLYERQSRIERKLERAQRKGNITREEQQAIDEHRSEVRERKQRAHRNGRVSGGEDRRITRAQRKMRREVRDAADE
jgi:hypothetical protein